jgi:hypothetical protein
MQFWKYIASKLHPTDPETFSTIDGKLYNTKYHNVIVVMPRIKFETLMLDNVSQPFFEVEDKVYGLCFSQKRLRLSKWQSMYPNAFFYTLTKNQVSAVKMMIKKCDDIHYTKVEKKEKKKDKKKNEVPSQQDYNSYLRSLKKNISEC